MNDKKKKDDKKKEKSKKKDDKEAGNEDEEGDELNRVKFSPSLDKCTEFLNSALAMMIESTNKVCRLEDDLMPFL